MLITQKIQQVVLTDFGPPELLELYMVEKLAFELWRASATLRSIGKGSPFVVADEPYCFRDDRSDELDWLLQHFDDRKRFSGTSTAAVVFSNEITKPSTAVVFVPAYNLGGVLASSLDPLVRHFSKDRVTIGPNMKFNFFWLPLELRSYRDAHTPYADAFRELHGVSLDAVLLVLASLLSRVLYLWTETEGCALVHHWQRAYEGPYERSYVRHEARAFRSAGSLLLGIHAKAVSDTEFDKALRFWTLTPSKRRRIDLPYSGRHEILLPYGKDRFFIDYAWIRRRLYDFFVGVRISDQNFKGDALERLIRKAPSLLPVRQCRATDGTSKQIDAAYAVGSHLVLIECKAVSRSIAFDRADPKAITYRREQVVERLLHEADEKANWLAKRPRGTNYSLQGILDILPVGVSPFVEFIPSRNLRYWVTEQTPRVVTPEELDKLLDAPTLINRSLNRVPIRRESVVAVAANADIQAGDVQATDASQD